MNATDIAEFIQREYEGVVTDVVSEDTFFFFDPDGTLAANRMFPFATLITGDRHDTVSNLSRSGVFRLNIGVSKQTFRTLFGSLAATGAGESPYDFTTLDRVMPHPVYGAMSWVCVLNPTSTTFEGVQHLLTEAHGLAVGRYQR